MSRALLRALIDPGPNQPDLLFGQRRNLVLVIGWRHEHIFVTDVRHIVNQHAFRAVADLNDFAVLAAFQSGCERVESQFSLLLFGSMTLDAGLLKDWFDINRV